MTEVQMQDATMPPEKDSAIGYKQALFDAAQAAIDSSRSRANEAPAKRRVGPKRWYLLFTLSLSAFGGWILLTQPPWFFTPPAGPEPVAIQEASARIALTREAQRVKAFRLTTGRLPATLLEARSTSRGIDYQRQGTERFTLTLATNAGPIMFRSTDSIPVFLGRSLKVISTRGTQ